MPSFGESPQFPLNAVGPKGQHAFIGVENLFFTGSTGLVGTMYGIPGVTATRVGTGVYRLAYPVARGVDIIAGIRAPSGMAYQVNVNQLNPSSGTAEIVVSKGGPVPTGVASGFVQPINPVAGAQASLLFFVAPVTPF